MAIPHVLVSDPTTITAWTHYRSRANLRCTTIRRARGLAGNHGIEDAAAAHADDVGEHRHELDVGVLQGLLNTLNVLGNLAAQLRSRPRQVAQFLNRGWRHKARSDQAVRQKVGNPHRVVDVTLAAGNIADMSRIRKYELEPTLQHVPDRLPVDARGLHRYVRDPLGRQPIREFQKIVRRC